MVEHSASVIVNAPIHQVYSLFTHLNDFPKYMSCVKEVTYYDEQRSHWSIQVGSRNQFEWDAVNEDWISDKQIGWRSTRGLRNCGRVKFYELGPGRTSVDVYIQYTLPSGALGSLSEHLGIDAHFDEVLQKDLQRFAHMVEETPTGSLDPMDSHYLFHKDSAVRRGTITTRQKSSMELDPMMSPQSLAERDARIQKETEARQNQEAERLAIRQRELERERQLQQAQQELLQREALKTQQERLAREKARQKAEQTPLDPRYTYAAWAHGLGDKDGLRARIPNVAQDPMTSRRPTKAQASSRDERRSENN